MPTKRKNKTVNYNKNKNKNSIHIKIDNSRKTNYKKSNAQQQARPQGFNFISQPTPAQQQPIILNIPGFNPIPNSTPTIPTHSPTLREEELRKHRELCFYKNPNHSSLMSSFDEPVSYNPSIFLDSLKSGGVTPSRSIGEKKIEPPLDKSEVDVAENPTFPLKEGGVDVVPSIGAMNKPETEETGKPVPPENEVIYPEKHKKYITSQNTDGEIGNMKSALASLRYRNGGRVYNVSDLEQMTSKKEVRNEYKKHFFQFSIRKGRKPNKIVEKK